MWFNTTWSPTPFDINMNNTEKLLKTLCTGSFICKTCTTQWAYCFLHSSKPSSQPPSSFLSSFFQGEKSTVTQRGYKKFPTVSLRGQRWEGSGMSDPTQKDHLYQAHPPPKANTLKLDFFFFPELLSSTTNSSFLWLRERWKLPTLWLLGDKTPACSRTFQQLHTKWRRLLYHTASALLSALCSDCFKILLLTTFPILSSEDLLSLAFCQCFPKKLKQNLQLSKFWNQRLQEQQDYREYHSPVQEDGLAAIFFLFIPANFYLLPSNNEIYGDYLECFPTCRKTTGLFGYYICFLFF